MESGADTGAAGIVCISPVCRARYSALVLPCANNEQALASEASRRTSTDRSSATTKR